MRTIDDIDDDYDVMHTAGGLELANPFGDDSVGFRAECECGWQGEWRDCVIVARRDAQAHRDGAVPPPDGVDLLMNGLLDLQDDLAQAVTWLAEHWSAHLPVPEAANGIEAASIRVLAVCTALDDLAQAAVVLGVPAVDDQEPDSYGMRYRRAIRRFGRVYVEVLASLGSDEVAA